MEHVLVVHGDDGLDEISVSGPTQISELKNYKIENYSITPQDFGLSASGLDEIAAQSPEDSLRLVREAFSGEQTLRIVLESIIRNVPKGEQSKKYGVSEEEFQSWHDHLIQNGGKIFDQSQHYNSKSRHGKKKMGPLAKLFLSFSLLTNLGLLIFGIVFSLNNENKKEEK